MKSFLKAVGVVTVFAMSQVVFAQTGNIAKIESGDIVQEDIHDFAIQMTSGRTIQPEKKNNRSLRVTIDSDGNRTYNFTGSGRMLWKTDKFFGKVELRDGIVEESIRIRYLPVDKNLEVGSEWQLNLRGSNQECGDWSAVWDVKATNGQSVKIKINGVEENVKTIRIVLTYNVGKSNVGGCDPIIKMDKDVLYSPELNDVVSFQESRLKTRGSEQYTSGYSVKTTSITKAKK